MRSRRIPVVFAAVFALSACALGYLLLAPVLSQQVVVLGRVEAVGVCDGKIKIDAVADRFEAFHCMRFSVRRVYRGRFDGPELGLILHSPSTTFWGKTSVGTRFLLGFADGRRESGGYLWLREERWVP